MMRILAQHCAHGGADRPRSSNLKPASPLPLVSHRPMQTVRQQPASLATGHDQQVCTPSLAGRRTDSHVHLLRILAQHPAHGGADRPRSVTLEPVSRCHSSCTGRCTRFGNNPRMRNGNWQRLCTPLPPVPAPQPEQLSRESAPHLVAASIDSRVNLMCILAQHRARGGTCPPRSLDLERVSPCHSSCKSPCTRLANNQRLMTSNGQRVCTPLLPSRCTGMRRQHNSRHPTLRPTKPRPCAQPARQSANLSAQLLRARSRATAGTPNRNERSTGTGTAST